MDYVEIRIARQEDHDDLAAIFNAQSEVLTSQFGEFFIAELIAFQNEDQKALVAQVQDKAVGLMSVSKDIDYKLLAESFELDPYDNLLKGDFMDALRYRRLEIEDEEHYEKIDKERTLRQAIRNEKFRCSLLGQRAALQEYCMKRESELKQNLEEWTQNEEKTKQFTKEVVEGIIDSFLIDFKLMQPDEIFFDQKTKDTDIYSWIIKEREFFFETLTFFGLPKNYMAGEGHWKDWARKLLEEKKNAAMRRGPMSKNLRTKTTKKKKQEDKKENELGPPNYFDIIPFNEAFKKFVTSGPDVRAQFRTLLNKYKQKFALLLSNEEGELIHDRIMDIYLLPNAIISQDIPLQQPMADVLPGMLECFGDIKYDFKSTWKNPLEETEKPQFKKTQTAKDKDPKGKKVEVKKDKPKEKEKDKEPEQAAATKEPPKDAPKEETKEVDPAIAKLTIEASKPVEYVEKYTSYNEIMNAVQIITTYDQMLCELGIISSNLVGKEVEAKKEKEEKEIEDEMKSRYRHKDQTLYDDLMQDVMERDGIPDIPLEAHNAIVINLFCIDDPYESRSIDFLFFASTLR